MRKDLLVPRAEITNLLVVYNANMLMQIRPRKTGNVTLSIWTIVAQQNSGVHLDLFAFISDPYRFICGHVFHIWEILESFRCIVSKDYVWSCGLLGVSICAWMKWGIRAILCNVHNLLSCIMLSSATHIYDRYDDYKAQRKYAQQDSHK